MPWFSIETFLAAIIATSGGKVVMRAGYYVAPPPNGSSANDGSSNRPWTLSYALGGAGGRIHPGDTVWLRGGTYVGALRSSVSGAPGKPVVIRQYPGERAIVDAAGAEGDQIVVSGAWCVFWGFEVMNSHPARTFATTGHNERPNLLINNASHAKYINLVIHDGGVAFYTYPQHADVELYGLILYNNGWQARDRGHGHALYLKSDVGPLVVRDNVVFNQFGYGIHAYSNGPTSGQLNNMHFEGNVAFNNGTASASGTAPNILLGGMVPARGGVVKHNLTYFSPGLTGSNMMIGFGSVKNGDVVVHGNYAVGGSPVLDLGNWTAATVADNTFIGPDERVTATPSRSHVVVRPNRYEPGRALIVVYNWAKLAAVPVALTGILARGDRYDVRNVQDLFGTPVTSGTFSGADVSIPLTGVTPPAPIGVASPRSPKTGPDFDAFVVTKTPN